MNMRTVSYFNFLPKGTESDSECGPNSLAVAQETGHRRRLQRVLEGLRWLRGKRGNWERQCRSADVVGMMCPDHTAFEALYNLFPATASALPGSSSPASLATDFLRM